LFFDLPPDDLSPLIAEAAVKAVRLGVVARPAQALQVALDEAQLRMLLDALDMIHDLGLAHDATFGSTSTAHRLM
jgi:hypothetical protein